MLARHEIEDSTADELRKSNFHDIAPPATTTTDPPSPPSQAMSGGR